MELEKKQLNKLKIIELAMLQKFIDVCTILNLKYYILGGTLLGAVRHNGFIPWDDDIDIGMPRTDYEIFVSQAQNLMTDEFFLQTYKTDKEFPANFAKIRNSNTTFIESSIRHRKINHGVFIDIFPLDYYPQYLKWYFNIKRILLTLRISYAFKNDVVKKKVKIARILTKLIYSSYKVAVKKREYLYKSVKNSKYIANFSGAWGKKEIVPKEWYGEGVELSFEGIKVIAPKEYDKWLTQVYGDYMTLPL